MNRFVVLEIDSVQQVKCAARTLLLDTLPRQYIREPFECHYLVVKHRSEADALERFCQCGHIFEQRTYLNPNKAAPKTANLSVLDVIVHESYQ